MRATTDHRYRAHAVMRRPQRRPTHETTAYGLSRGRVNSGGIEGSGVVEIGQEPGESIGQHRFARTGRSDHEQVVTTGGGDLNGEPGQRMATNFGEIGSSRWWRHERLIGRTGPRSLGL